MVLVFSVGTQTDPDFSISEENFLDLSCFLVHVFKVSGFESLREEGFSAVVRNIIRFSYPYFVVLIPNVDFKPVFKPVAINIDFSSSFNSFSLVLVDCIWPFQNYIHLTQFNTLSCHHIRSSGVYLTCGKRCWHNKPGNMLTK